MRRSFVLNLGAIIVLVFFLYFGFRIYKYIRPGVVAIVPRPEVEIKIIPGWNLRQVADYLVLKGFASSTADVYKITGKPAFFYNYKTGPAPYPNIKIDIELYRDQSYEGFLAPETYRVFADASVQEIINKLVAQRDSEFTTSTYEVIRQAKFLDNNFLVAVRQLITMASIIEKETKHDEDRAKVADILWRRLKQGWALQVDSSVHYAVDKTGTVFTTERERAVDSPWNTYKYPGLPPGPICNPGLESINAALYPEPNNYWYFLSGRDGKMYYAKTLEEHNKNKRYL
ncbi:MAG: endolytic transglycosylase MltG [Candidatus Azambacteria bacterium]|nr:endolytic transglycosylase MltG [Candidatus Azambacteria bacterium]